MSITSTKTLFISYDGMTDPLGQSQVIPYLSGLAEAGYKVTILSFEKKERYEKGKELISRILAEKNIVWVPLFYTRRPPVLSTLWDVYKLMSTAGRLHKENKFSVIHCRSYISALAGLNLKRRFGVKFIFDMRGFWADERVEGKIWNLNNPLYKTIYRYFKSKERQFLQEADYTISLTESAKDIIHSWKDVKGNPVPIQVIPCCADLSLFDYHSVHADKADEMKRILSIVEGDFVISYLGSIGTWYMLEEMLDFFKELLNSKPNARFLFITGDAPDDIIGKAQVKGITPDKLIIRKAARREVPVMLALCKLSLFFIRPTFSKQASSPTKQGEIMGMGIPLVCNSGVGDTETIVRNTGGGVVIKDLNSSDYIKAIAGMDDILKTDPGIIRMGAVKYYSLQDGIKKYSEVYQNILV